MKVDSLLPESNLVEYKQVLTDTLYFEVINQATDQVTDQAQAILIFCHKARSSKEIMLHLGLIHKPHFREKLLMPLLLSGKLTCTIPDKLTSPKQKYISVVQIK